MIHDTTFNRSPPTLHSWHTTGCVKVLILLNSRKWRTSLMWLNVPWFLYLFSSPPNYEIWSCCWKTGALTTSFRDQLLKKENRPKHTCTHTHTQRTYSRACTTLPVDTLHTTQTIAVFKKKYSINFRKSKLILRLDVLRYVYPYCTFMHLRQVTKKTCKNCIICKVKTKMRLTWETFCLL